MTPDAFLFLYNNNNNIYLLQLGCYPVAVSIKIWRMGETVQREQGYGNMLKGA